MREIFVLYLETGSIFATITEVNRRGWTTKSWTTQTGKFVRGSEFAKATLHRVLNDPAYVGRSKLEKDTFVGLHTAIVEKEELQAPRHGWMVSDRTRWLRIAAVFRLFVVFFGQARCWARPKEPPSLDD